MDDKQELNIMNPCEKPTNESENYEESCASEKDILTTSSDSKTNESKKNNEIKPVEIKDEWPLLTIDMIGTSLKVVGDLPANAKLKIVNNSHFAEDNSIMGSISRYSRGQGRDKVISFMDHLFIETERNIWSILRNIREKSDVDTNVSVLQGTVAKLHIFLHRYENMRAVYKSDSSAFARLGNY